jgi:hypothetical protein
MNLRLQMIQRKLKAADIRNVQNTAFFQSTKLEVKCETHYGLIESNGPASFTDRSENQIAVSC